MAKKGFLNLPDNAVQRWKSFVYGDTAFDFSHINARKITFKHPERNESYNLFITFSHHVFTRSLKPEDSLNDPLVYPYPSDVRIFDDLRYELSKYLPEIIDTLPTQFCYHGGHGRYCSCKITLESGVEIHYQVVYRVWKEKGKMRFHIESAYPLPGNPGRVKKVDFWVICHNLLTGKKMPSPGV